MMRFRRSQVFPPPGAHRAPDPLDFRWVRTDLQHIRRVLVCAVFIAGALLLVTIGVALYTIANTAINHGC